MVEERKEKKSMRKRRGKKENKTAKDNTVGAKIPKSAVTGVNLIQSKDKNIRQFQERETLHHSSSLIPSCPVLEKGGLDDRPSQLPYSAPTSFSS